MAKKLKPCPAWLATFADMMSLLMAVFVLLFAMSIVEESKYVEVVESLSVALGWEGTLSPEQVRYIESVRMKQEAKEKASEAESSKSSSAVQIQESVIENLKPLYESLIKTYATGEDSNKIKIKYDSGRDQVKVVFPEQIAFDAGRAELKPRFAELLKNSYKLKNEAVFVKVIGHTDKRPVTGGRFYSNWELSSARAASVVVTLVASGRLRPDQVQAVGVADTIPVSSGTTEADFAKNRRVEVIISPEAFKYR